MIAIQEVRDLTKLSMEELIGSFMTHKLNMHQKEEEEEPKKKTIAFKSTTKFEESYKSEDESKEEDEDMGY